MKNMGARLAVDRVKAGKVVIPGALIKPVIGVLDHLLAGSNLYGPIKESARSVRQIRISDTQLKIFYDWDPGAMDKLHETGKSILISASYQEKLVLYYNKLVEVSMPHKNRRISMAKILNPMFRFAAGQSDISNDPILENTALLQVMSLYASGNGLKAFVLKDIQKQVKPMVKISLTLLDRNDLARHFLISAGLAVSGGSKLANFIGLAKEVGDSDHGSGFSFADLAADKAGVKMGELAISSGQAARLLQVQMGNAAGETAFMPVIDNLPEGIMELEFKKNYTDLDSDSYAMVNQEIEKRISQCPVYQ
jgi:hypothetical protein